jgi:putative hydrolase
MVATATPEPGRLARVTEELRRSAASGEPLVGEAGIMGIFASEEQRGIIDQIQALMSLLEGHGHVIMDRIGARMLVSQRRMSATLKRRRQDPRTAAFFRLTGLEMKLKQYALGETFVLTVERQAGFETVDLAWTSPAHLPTLDEIKEPRRWLERVA